MNPTRIFCNCGKTFVMMERAENCPYCGMAWSSHRASEDEKARVEKIEDNWVKGGSHES